MNYIAIVTREDGTWLAEVEGLPGAHAYATTLTRLRKEIADAIILSADLEDDAQVEITFTLAGHDDDLMRKAFEVAEQRRQVKRAEAEIVAETANLARSLIEAGWSVRDAAGALDVTSGRVSQLVPR